MKGLVILAFVLTASAGCSKDAQAEQSAATGEFLKTYSGKFVEPEFKERIEIQPDGHITRLEVRQVGGNSAVPYPTVCSYYSRGTIKRVEARNARNRADYMDFATHVIHVKYSLITLTDELEPTTSSNPNCKTFVDERMQESLSYSYYSELLSNTSFRIHTSGGGDYVKGQPRTPSTLDEVYTKVNE